MIIGQDLFGGFYTSSATLWSEVLRAIFHELREQFGISKARA